MKKHRKRKSCGGQILSSMLVLCLLFSMLPTVALAVEGKPEGETVVECTQAEDCTATEHKEVCPLYEVPPIDEESVDNETPAEPPPTEPTAAEQVAALIAALPKCADATPEDVAAIEAAQVAYDALTAEEQAAMDAELVTKLADLTELAEDLNAYEASNDASVYETTPAMSGTCGAEENESAVTWALTQNNVDNNNPTYTLTISGSGAMTDFTYALSDHADTRPWKDHASSISQIKISEGLTAIGDNAFRALTALKTTNIPASVTDLGDHIFRGCSALETVIWAPEFEAPVITDTDSNSETYTGKYVPTSMFDGCSSLGRGKELSAWLPDSFVGIGCAAFRGTQFTIAFDNWDSLNYIGAYAFSAMDNLDSFTLSNKIQFGLRENASNAFNSSGLKKLIVQSQSIPLSFVTGSTSLATITLKEGLVSLADNAFKDTGVTEIDIPASVTTIGEGAFAGCAALKKVTLRGNTTLAASVFSGTNIEEFTIPKNANVQCTQNPFAASGQYRAVTSLKKVELLGGLENDTPSSLWMMMFSGNNALKNVTVSGENVANVGQQAFPAMETLLVQDGSATVLGYNFSGNTALKYIEFNVNTYSSASGSFRNAKGLKTLRLKSSQATLDDRSFVECSSLIALDFTGCDSITYAENCFSTMVTAGTNNSSMNSKAIIYVNSSSADPKVSHIETGLSNTHGVVAVTNGGTFSGKTVFESENLALPVKEGYAFAGWYTKDGTNGDWGEKATTATVGQTYYAKWVNEITFNANGGSGTMTPQKITEGATTNLTANEFTKTGYTFSGWNTSADGAGTSYGDQVTAPNSATTLYAQWTPNTYTISFNANGGSGTTANVGATYDTPATLTANGFTKSGYNFAGWTTTSGGTVVEYSDGAQVLNLTATASGTITLYAVWTTKTVLAPDVTAQTKTYNGAAQAFLLDGTYTITYQRNGQAATPKDVGTYDMVISAAETDTTAAYKNTVYGGLVINKAALTITPNNKTAYVGDALPALGANDYTVTGLVGSDTLSTAPTLAYNGSPDMNTAGTYTIKASGADAGSNYTITYVDGALTISRRSSGGGGGGSSGSSSGVSGSGGNVSVSAGGGSVSNSQMTAAVDKANEGATIGIKATSSTAVTLPVSGMEKAAANDNHVTVTTRSGEVTLSTAAIEGLVEGASASQSIQVSVTTATATAAGVEAGTPVFDVSVSVGSTAVHSFDGSLRITLTVSNLSKIEDPHVLHILTDGTKQYLKPTVKGNQLTVSGIRNLSYFAVIPGSEIPAAPEPLPFTDVAADFWAYDAISYVYEKGLFAGTSETTFSPNVTMTREMLWTVLGRLSGAELTGAGVFEQARQWAVSNGVSDGTNGGNTITREQMVTMLYRYAGSPAAGGALTGYADASTVSGYAADAMAWAVGSGIISGTSATTLSPQGSATRAQVATILMRFVENTEK